MSFKDKVKKTRQKKPDSVLHYQALPYSYLLP